MQDALGLPIKRVMCIPTCKMVLQTALGRYMFHKYLQNILQSNIGISFTVEFKLPYKQKQFIANVCYLTN